MSARVVLLNDRQLVTEGREAEAGPKAAGPSRGRLVSAPSDAVQSIPPGKASSVVISRL